MSPWLLIYLLFVHWVADFVLQSDKMAIGKSTSNRWLSIHVGIYTWFLWATAGAWAAFIALALPAWIPPVYAALNGALHWVTDYFTSRWTSRLWKAERRHDFFVVVGFDQLIHAATLITTAHFLLR